MRAQWFSRYVADAAPVNKSSSWRRVVAAAAVFAVAVAFGVPAASAAPPAPCGGTPQITDAKGDGHHTNTDVTAAWLTEAGGRLQAVVQVDFGLWEPAHPDSAQAGIAVLYELAGQTRYVRVTMTFGAPPAFDHGTWTRAGGFLSQGATGAEVTTGAGATVTLDVPAVVAGTVLARPFALTYDGEEAGQPHWVDRAPGATTPDDTSPGADYVAGSCSAGPPPGGTPTGPVTTTAIDLKAPRKLTGSGRAKLTGKVTPARAGVKVAITATARRSSTRTVTTGVDGSFSLSLPISETTRVRAVAEGLGSQTLTVQMYSKVRIKVRRLKSGTVVVSGTTSPKLSGRILWLRSNAVRPSARTSARNGRFTLRFQHPRRGRYQAVFIPSGGRAERSTSNTGVIR